MWWLWALLALVAGAVTVATAEGFPIVDLELAWTVDRADEVVAGTAIDIIRRTIAWDFLFIALYALALSTGSLWARRQFVGQLIRGTGVVLATGGVVVGVFDIIENVAMLGYLNGWSSWTGWIPLAGAMAVPKFALALATVFYIVAGLALFVARRIRR